MLLESIQLRAIKTYVKAFNTKNPGKTMLTEIEYNKYKKFYRSQKFETLTISDFKVIVSGSLLYKDFPSIPKMINYLNETPLKELKKLLIIREQIQTLDYTIDKDKNYLLNKYGTDETVSLENVIKEFKNKTISVFYFYFHYFHYFKEKDVKYSRIKQKAIDKMLIFMWYLPQLRKYLENYFNRDVFSETVQQQQERIKNEHK